jgi:hypothetical protein
MARKRRTCVPTRYSKELTGRRCEAAVISLVLATWNDVTNGKRKSTSATGSLLLRPSARQFVRQLTVADSNVLARGFVLTCVGHPSGNDALTNSGWASLAPAGPRRSWRNICVVFLFCAQLPQALHFAGAIQSPVTPSFGHSLSCRGSLSSEPSFFPGRQSAQIRLNHGRQCEQNARYRHTLHDSLYLDLDRAANRTSR